MLSVFLLGPMFTRLISLLSFNFVLTGKICLLFSLVHSFTWRPHQTQRVPHWGGGESSAAMGTMYGTSARIWRRNRNNQVQHRYTKQYLYTVVTEHESKQLVLRTDSIWLRWVICAIAREREKPSRQPRGLVPTHRSPSRKVDTIKNVITTGNHEKSQLWTCRFRNFQVRLYCRF